MITDFLKESVYPELDAVEAGLLDFFNPVHKKNNYLLDCPQCGKHEAFYFPYSSYINCPRGNECGHGTSLWDALLKSGYSNAEVVERLCGAVGVKPPSSNSSYEPSLSDLIVKITKSAAKSSQEKIIKFCQMRGLSAEEFNQMQLGYYPSSNYVLKALESEGADIDKARSMGFVKEENEHWFGMEGRIVGYWKQPDGSIRLWGRAIESDVKPKYLFTSTACGMVKTVPYLYKSNKSGRAVCAVEGMLDAASLKLLGHNGNAIGQSAINENQATFYASDNVEKIVYITDSDGAGIKGAFKSIESCSPLGIEINIAMLGNGMDDIDALRKANRSDDILKAIKTSVPAPVFLANMVVAANFDSRMGPYKVMAQRLASNSNSEFQSRYNKQLAVLGVNKNPVSDSLLMIRTLIDNGIDQIKATEIANRKYHTHITFGDIK